MKTRIFLIAASVLLTGCQKTVLPTPAVPAPTAPPEYKVVIFQQPNSIAEIADSKRRVAAVEKDLSDAKIKHRMKMNEITATEAECSNLQANAGFYLTTKRIEWSCDEQNGSNIWQSVTENSTNGWELVGTLPDNVGSKKSFLIFKRPSVVK